MSILLTAWDEGSISRLRAFFKISSLMDDSLLFPALSQALASRIHVPFSEISKGLS